MTLSRHPSSPDPRPPRGGRRRRAGTLTALTSIVAMVGTSLVGAGASTAAPATERAEVAEELRAAVAAAGGDRVQAMVILDAAADVAPLSGDRTAVLDSLQETAATSQNDFDILLEETAAFGEVDVVNSFWLTNAVLLEFTADQDTLSALADLPGVDRIIPNFELTGIEPEVVEAPAQDEGPTTWGIDRIGADRVWEELGLTGSGIRVATLDTGVDISHPDLAGKMVTVDPNDPTYPGGWMEFDANGGLMDSEPYDTAYHGTHVAGTIHGGSESGQAIGVAPDSDMMHGVVIPGGGGSFAQVVAGMQWAIAPVDSAGNPAGEPADVVNMSLGANGFHDDMVAPTINMRAAGVVPAFAIGNNCGTFGTGSPGNVFESFAVGNTDIDGNVNPSSCGAVVQKIGRAHV